MKHQSKFTSRSQEQNRQEQIHGQEQKQTSVEFANVEEMFRHDALHTPEAKALISDIETFLKTK